jgi:LmbE family N-acetylglucosaminyl deacetylase
MVVRKQEDTAAMTVLGATVVYGGLKEALYRCDSNGFPLYDGESIFGTLNEDDALRLAAPLKGQMGRWIEAWRPNLLIGPAAIGGHVDHVLARQVVESAEIPALLYQDIPYAVLDPNADAGVAYAAVSISHAAWEKKLLAISCYASQQGILWADSARWQIDLTRHATEPDQGLVERFQLCASFT